MRDLTQDSRLVLLMLGASAVEATGRALVNLWQRSKRTTRVAQQLRHLETVGLIEARGAGPVDARLFRLSAQGREAVFGPLDPEALWARPWDGVWRIVMFDVPQAQAALRVRLRRTLRQLRFGWLQNSVWLSPDPLNQLVEQLGRADITPESLLFIEGRPAGGETDAELVAAAWDFPRLAKLHKAYLQLLRLRPSANRTSKPNEWTAWLETEARAWRELTNHDPFLPAALLPDDYAGRDVWRARREALHEVGQSLAQQFASA